MDDKVFATGSEEKFIFLKIEETMNKKVLKCDGKNEVSTQTASFPIELMYGPKIVKELPSHYVARPNENVEFACEVDSNPPATFVWTLNDTFLYSYPKLIIHSVRNENYGVYRCTASVINFPKVSSSVILLPPGKTV
mgnify:CR=1 FL=1